MKIKQFLKGHNHFKGLQFLDGEEFKEDVMREFAGILREDPVIHQQVVGDSPFNTFLLTLDLRTSKLDSWKEFKKKMEVAIIQERTEKIFDQTLYVFHNDWLLYCEETHHLIVADENKIHLFYETKSVDLEA